MALVRLGVVLALASCGRASGDTGGLVPPAGWRALPELASAVGSAAHLPDVQAWGEPARGCYAVAIAADGGGDIATEMLAALAADKVATTDVVKPASGAGILSFTLERGPYRGKVRARLDADRVRALACYHDQREPLACETACAAFLGTLSLSALSAKLEIA